LSDLPASQWNHWQAVLDRFEQAWRDADNVDLAAFLPPGPDGVRPLILQELIKTELEIRWRRGRGTVLEDYIQRFPEVAANPHMLPGLLYEEYRVRRLYGDRPGLEGYRKRFPDQFAELERLLQEQDVPPAGSSTVRPGEGTVPPAAAPGPPRQAPLPPAAPGALAMFGRGTVLPVGGGCKLIERLGHGQFGEVWRAEAPGGIEVALKIIFRPLQHDDAQREREALEVVKRLRHPFLVQMHTFDSVSDRLLIVMELADGNLRGRLKECRQANQQGIPPDELLVYMHEACEALDFLHARRVLHRDIKPDNILLVERHAKLADLGLARMLEATRSFTATTCGSPPYMAPEVWAQHAGSGSDQYSLAASYVELRRGRMLFAAGDWVQLMLAHREGKLDLEGLPEPEQAVLSRALAREPADRFPTCVEFFRALEEVVAPARPTATLHKGPVPQAPLTSPASDGALTPRLPDLAGSEAGPNGSLAVPAAHDSQALAPTLSPSAAHQEGADRKRTRPAGRDWRGESSSPTRRRLLWLAAGLLPLLVVGGILYRVHSLTVATATTGHEGPTTRVDTTRSGPASDTEPHLPPRWVKGDGAEVKRIGGKPYYTRIAYQLADGTPVVFRLMLANAMPAYYIMETKVSNHMYHQYASDKQLPDDAPWKRGARMKEKDLGIEGHLDWPVYRLTVDEAHAFAAWLGGELPTVDQWDWAGGRSDDPRPAGPFDPKLRDLKNQENFALAQTGPRPVREAPADFSSHGCRGMASNGYEWTCTVGDRNGNREVPFGRYEKVNVFLRGASYTNEEPFTFDALETGGGPEVRERYRDPDLLSDVSFRVVLPVPPGPVDRGS
jgi:serine/threonine protein kinase